MLTSWSQVLPGATYLQNNNYYAEGNAYHFIWNNTEYLSFQDWRAAAGGQEKSGNELLGMTLDPLLMDAGTGTVTRTTRKAGFSGREPAGGMAW